MDDRYDGALMGILQHEGKLDRFLDVMFSFLCRRTDFYHIMTSERQNMGFPRGVALNMVMNSYKKFEVIHQQKYGDIGGAIGDVPGVAETVEIVAENSSSPVKNARPAADNRNGKPTEENQASAASNQPRSSPQRPQPTKPAASSVESSKTADDSSDQTYQAPPESYNGADRGTFSWSQTIGDLDLRVRVPDYIKKAKDVKVKLTRKTLSIEIREEASDEFKSLLEDEFPWDVNTEESMWSLLPADKHIHINVEKVKERWWDKALKNEADAIDVRKIDCSRPITDLDDESQVKIQQLMYDQRQKELGLPTSEEQKMSNLLAKAWNAEGSPFEGQPFDPSRLRMGPDGSATID